MTAPLPSQPNKLPIGHGSRFDRRDFLRLSGLVAGGLTFSQLPIVAGPFTKEDFEKLVPADKKLHPDWVRSLFAHGNKTTYHWPESRLIGMPIGGICAGQLYLGGDGKLWHWDIFNRIVGTGDGNYAHPPQPASPIEQGFALKLTAAGKTTTRPLDHTGWSNISFNGEYPIAFIEYRDPASPATVALEAFSPFIPLNTEDSALPATVMRFTVKNTSNEKVEVELAGWLQNGVCLHTGASLAGTRRNRLVERRGFRFLECSAAAPSAQPRTDKRPDIVFEDFEKPTYEGWTSTGTAFGSGPVTQAQVPDYQGELGIHGQRTVNTHASAPGNDVGARDAATGTLTSTPFVITRDYITLLIGGGSHAGRTCINLLVEDRVVVSATGHDANRMQPHSLDVRRWAGQTARLQIVDNEPGAWGNIGIDDIVFSDEPRGNSVALAEQHDFGTMGLAVLGGAGANVAATALAEPVTAAGVFSQLTQANATAVSRPFDARLVGALGRRFTLKPGQSATVTFVLTWHFPNIQLRGLPAVGGRWYGTRFPSAQAVAEYVSANFDRLAGQTHRWHDTWYDSTLPYWFLDRTFLNTSILATNTCYWFGNRRFYAWEGVGCCEGTCAHVWHYAHAMGRLFPLLERQLRELVDYGVAFDKQTGRIRFRAEHNDHWAVDAQAGIILRTYREHQMSADGQFLGRVWPHAKRALEFLIGKDEGRDGLVDGPQHNTLDADWFGHVAWLSGLYLAALRAGEEMATEMGDTAFARQCRDLWDRGRHTFDRELFNGEYYYQLGDPAHAKTVGSYDGCEIDQVFGQSWAWQVGLGRILDEAQVKTALRSLWRCNFTPDVGPYRAANKPGRWYAMPGEAGLLMCSWPRGDAKRVSEGFDFYFNECMNGFEYQVAWHMIAEGMVQEGLAINRSVHDRYHAAKRNPWNEVECGDHYARSMASYGVFLAACGYEYHGPKGHLGFAPRLTPEDFRCAFTTAEGWGAFHQKLGTQGGQFDIQLKWGRLRLRTLSFALTSGALVNAVKATAGGKAVAAQIRLDGATARITLNNELILREGQHLHVELT
ncbi:MAG: GH116 family glycosyl-hydrolase [Verrucomicrobiota bacterium]|jgi:uncharacterized protein (DUF608 family)